MYIAQKILKSMSSISAEVSEDNDETDDLAGTTKSAPVSTPVSPTISDREPSLTPPSDENFAVDPLFSDSFEPATDMTNSKTSIFRERKKHAHDSVLLDVTDGESSPAFDTSMMSQPVDDSAKVSSPGSMDTFDLQ